MGIPKANNPANDPAGTNQNQTNADAIFIGGRHIHSNQTNQL
jgi:hypothetical protein